MTSSSDLTYFRRPWGGGAAARVCALALLSAVSLLANAQTAPLPSAPAPAAVFSKPDVSKPDSMAVNAAASDNGVSIDQWLERVHAASRQQSFAGTFVVNIGGQVSASKIWHASDANRQVERIDTLTGPARTTFRHDDLVVTLVPERQVVWVERREALRRFPDVLRSPSLTTSKHYVVKPMAGARVAGKDTDAAIITPLDSQRFGYRIWTEKATGLVLQMQTLDTKGQVLEQVAFTEVSLNPDLNVKGLLAQMTWPKDHKVLRPVMAPTTPEAQGWSMPDGVPGFQTVAMYARPQAQRQPALHWVLSDGLATVSVFIDDLQGKQDLMPAESNMGATHAVSRQVGGHWMTAMGEVPSETLRQFLRLIQRVQ